ncbi:MULTISPECIES: flagellar protein FlaG [Halomonas]|uniref:Flagellar protein FlaG n=1 Tax=Halomonas chromatireducens TaxID=507626 RepID=A0A0X8HHH5_9GAMM|nr:MULTISPECIES: flagellar protein FlaG [Halomonas]AMD02699.1 flagellar protein FlaG [Halomonas chromatireducens]MBZ0329292.1 flagellar protein FlaG [Halomonas sp. ANAO-440]
MSSPLTDATNSLSASALHDLTPRQRKESVLASLPAAGTMLSQAESHGNSPAQADLVEPIQRINEVLRQHGVEFELNEMPSRVVTRIVDRETGDVLRQIPSEEVLAIAERLDELQGRLIRLEA